MKKKKAIHSTNNTVIQNSVGFFITACMLQRVLQKSGTTNKTQTKKASRKACS